MDWIIQAGIGVSLWVAGAIYAVNQRHREHFMWRLLIALAVVGVFCTAMSFWWNGSWQSILIYAGGGYLLEVWLLFFCSDIALNTALYYGTWVLVTQQIIHEMWQVSFFRLAGAGWLAEKAGIYLIGEIFFFAFSFALCGLTIARWMPEEGQFKIGPRQLSSALVLMVVIELLHLMLLDGEGRITDRSGWNVLVLAQVFCILLLYLQNELFKKSAMRQELVTMNLLWQKEKAQYSLAKENIALIDRKCHDLKHQINALRNIVGKEERERYLDEIEDSVRIYESIVKTGNEVLDTILTEKSLYCKENRIQISCVADGSQMDFIDPVDLYTILGNALDNAIECVQQFTEKERRQIDVQIHRQRQFLLIHILNPIGRVLVFEDNLPVTTKADKGYHGYGLKSIRHAVKKYDGFLTVGVEDGCFSLKILIPVPSVKEIKIY